MKSSLSLFTKLLQQVFKKNHGSLILLRFAFSKKYYFLRMCIHTYICYLFFCDQIYKRLYEKISDYINLATSMPYVACWWFFFFFFKKECLDCFNFFWKKYLMKWKYLMWQNAHKWGPHKIQYNTLVKSKNDCDKTGYRLFFGAQVMTQKIWAQLFWEFALEVLEKEIWQNGLLLTQGKIFGRF